MMVEKVYVKTVRMGYREYSNIGDICMVKAVRKKQQCALPVIMS